MMEGKAKQKEQLAFIAHVSRRLRYDSYRKGKEHSAPNRLNVEYDTR